MAPASPSGLLDEFRNLDRDRRDGVGLRDHDQGQEQRAGVEDAVRQRDVAVQEIAFHRLAQRRAARLEDPVIGGGVFQPHRLAPRERVAPAHDQAGLLDADDAASNSRGLRSSGMRAMMKSWRVAISSRASTLEVSTCMVISMRG